MKQPGTNFISFILRNNSNSETFFILTIIFIVLLLISILLLVLLMKETRKENDIKRDDVNQFTNGLEENTQHIQQQNLNNSLPIHETDIPKLPVHVNPILQYALLFSEMMRTYCLLLNDYTLYDPSDIPEFTSELFNLTDGMLVVFHENYNSDNGTLHNAEWIKAGNAVIMSQSASHLLGKLLMITCGLAGFMTEKELETVKQVLSALSLKTAFIDATVKELAIKIVKQEAEYVTHNSFSLNMHIDANIEETAKAMVDTDKLEILSELVQELKNKTAYPGYRAVEDPTQIPPE